jgi:hypothetical protein
MNNKTEQAFKEDFDNFRVSLNKYLDEFEEKINNDFDEAVNTQLMLEAHSRDIPTEERIAGIFSKAIKENL